MSEGKYQALNCSKLTLNISDVTFVSICNIILIIVTGTYLHKAL